MMKAQDVMTSQVATVRPDTPVNEVAQIMLDRGVSGMPVVDEGGQLQGVVSEGDLMHRAEAGTDRRRRSWWLRLMSLDSDDARDYVKSHGSLARDVMSHPAITVAPDEDIAEVAMLLEKHRIKRVPVAEGGRLLGVVSRADLLRALAVAAPVRPVDIDDKGIRSALMKHLEAQTWTNASVNVIVQDGVVNLWGLYDSDEQHEAYLLAARNTPGARGVRDHMSQSMLT